MRCSNHFCGANAIRPYHFPLWQIASAPYPKALFGEGGCRCADMVVTVVRKGWLPLFGNGGLQMPFATLADGICNHRRWHLRPLQMAFAHHLFRTSNTTTSERRPPGFSNIVHHPFRTPTADTSNAAGSPAVSGRRISRILYVIFGLAADRYLPVYQYFNQSFMLASPLSVLSPSAHGCLHHQTLFITLPKFNFELQRYVFLFKQTKTFFLKVIMN